MGRKRRRRGLPAWPLGRSDGDRKKAGCAHPFTRACVHKRMRPCAVTKQVFGVSTHFSVVLHLTTEAKGKRGKPKEICRAHYGQSWRISLGFFLVARAEENVASLFLRLRCRHRNPSIAHRPPTPSSPSCEPVIFLSPSKVVSGGGEKRKKVGLGREERKRATDPPQFLSWAFVF